MAGKPVAASLRVRAPPGLHLAVPRQVYTWPCPARYTAVARASAPGRAALCARGRRPAREIATREPDGSEWSISRPALALPPPSGTAAWPRRPRGGLQSGVRACPGPAAALHTGGAFGAVWCRPGLAGPAAASDRACACLSWPCRRPPAPRPDPAGPAAGSGTCFRGMYSAISHVIPLRVFQVLKSDR